MTCAATELDESSGAMVVAGSGASRRPKRLIECHVMRRVTRRSSRCSASDWLLVCSRRYFGTSG
jgi:hypothetical protein